MGRGSTTPLEAHQAAETILSDIAAHPGADFREHDVPCKGPHGMGNAGED